MLGGRRLYSVKEIVPPDTVAAFPVMAGPYGVAENMLAPAEAWFVDRIDRELRTDGYRLAGTFEPGNAVAAGVVGFRRVLSNAWGNHLWVEDFITGEIGAAAETNLLLMYLESEAKRLGLTQIHIDVLPIVSSVEKPEKEKARELDRAQLTSELSSLVGPRMDRLTAAIYGFREVAGRFVLKIGNESEEIWNDKGRRLSPPNCRQHFGWPGPRRRGD